MIDDAICKVICYVLENKDFPSGREREREENKKVLTGPKFRTCDSPCYFFQQLCPNSLSFMYEFPGALGILE